MYIVFEGIDTTGKSTQIELFKKLVTDNCKRKNQDKQNHI